MSSGDPIIGCHGVAVRFGPTAALSGVDLGVGAGEIVAVHGASGAGKSTLLFCLAGIIRPDEGAVLYAGSRIDGLRDHDRTLLRRREFGFVFQFAQLVPELTARENVEVPLLLNGVPRNAARERALAMLSRVGVADGVDLRAGELSGGQAQLVAVARALVHQPRVVFADEPTGALHSAAGDHVMRLLVEIAETQHTAVILVTHDNRVAAYAQREVLLRDGIVTERAGAR